MSNKTTHVQQNNGCNQVQLEGVGFYGQSTNNFFFAPDNPVVEQVRRFRRLGIAQQLSDGSFDFVAKPDYHAKSTLIRKLAHGRLSETRDGAIQLTIKIFKNENICISEAMTEETDIAVDALIEYQLKR